MKRSALILVVSNGHLGPPKRNPSHFETAFRFFYNFRLYQLGIKQNLK